jgi:hypothetical protein
MSDIIQVSDVLFDFSAGFTSPPSRYVGFGDIVTATGYWGTRAYTFASIGNRVIRLRRDSDNAEIDFVTVAGGGLDFTSVIGINAFKGSANLFVTQLYDQTGNGVHFAQATAANQPQFKLNVINGLPGIFYVSATPLFLVTNLTESVSAPYSFSAVSNRTIFASAVGVIIAEIITGTQISFTSSANTFRVVAVTTAITQSETDGNFHSLHGIVNDPNTLAVVDGAASAPGTTGNGAIGDAVVMGSFAGSFGVDGYINEVAIVPAALTSTQYGLGAPSSSITANQKYYWSF